MKRILTKFWMKTPVGKLEFNRRGIFTWEMCGTKGGFERRLVELSSILPTSRAVIHAFGWITAPEIYIPYGEVYEEIAAVPGPKRHWYTAQALNGGVGRPEGRIQRQGMNRRKGDRPKPAKIEPLIRLHGTSHLPGIPHVGGAVWALKEGRDTLIFTSKEDLEAYCAQQLEKI